MSEEPPEGPEALGSALASHFYANLCYVCKASSPTLKRCGRCKLIAYCSTDHQREHWTAHKAICNCVDQLVKSRHQISLFQDAPKLTNLEWKHFRVTLIAILEQKLGRCLQIDEMEMLQSPRVCETCHSDVQSILKDCSRCLCVAFCPEHSVNREQHDHWCFALRLARIMYINELQHGFQFPALPDRIAASYRPLPADVFALMNLDYAYNLSCCQALKHQEHNLLDTPSYVTPLVQLAYLSERLSFPLSVLYAFEQIIESHYPFALKTCSELVLHIVGSEIVIEGADLKKWRVFLHRLPKLRHLRLIFIGPELCSEGTYTSTLDRRKITFQMIHGFLYHDYAQSPIYIRPNAIIAFNCGIHEATSCNPISWLPSIPFLLHPKIPFILTSYNQQECLADVAKICETIAEAKVIISPRCNPFASQRPFRDWAEDDDRQVFYLNGYIAALSKAS